MIKWRSMALVPQCDARCLIAIHFNRELSATSKAARMHRELKGAALAAPTFDRPREFSVQAAGVRVRLIAL